MTMDGVVLRFVAIFCLAGNTLVKEAVTKAYAGAVTFSSNRVVIVDVLRSYYRVQSGKRSDLASYLVISGPGPLIVAPNARDHMIVEILSIFAKRLAILKTPTRPIAHSHQMLLPIALVVK